MTLSANRDMESQNPLQAPRDPVQEMTAPKMVRKRRSSRRKMIESDSRAYQGVANEDLLRLMMCRLGQEREDQENLVHLQQAQTDEITHLRETMGKLNQEIGTLKSGLEHEKGINLEHELLRSKLESRIKKLKGFLNGLGNDHGGLRDQARELLSQQTLLQKESEEQKEHITNLHATIEKECLASRENVTKAQHQCRILEESILTLRTQLRDSHESLERERACKASMERGLSQISSNIAQMNGCLKEQGKDVLLRIPKTFYTFC